MKKITAEEIIEIQERLHSLEEVIKVQEMLQFLQQRSTKGDFQNMPIDPHFVDAIILVIEAQAKELVKWEAKQT